MLFIDLDRFKEVNDEHGHTTGDRALVMAAHRLRVAFRPSDLLARVGGDEFAALCESFQSPEEVRRVGRRLIASLEKPIRIAPSTEVRLSACVGIAFAARFTEHASTLTDRADLAMYRAKQRGTGQVHISGLSSAVPEGLSQDESDEAVTRALEQLVPVESDLAGEWARSLAALDAERTSRWRTASRHVAEAIAVLRGRAG